MTAFRAWLRVTSSTGIFPGQARSVAELARPGPGLADLEEP